MTGKVLIMFGLVCALRCTVGAAEDTSGRERSLVKDKKTPDEPELEQQVDLGEYSFYFVVKEQEDITYFEAERRCAERNMSLVSLQSQDKDVLVFQFIEQNPEFDVWFWTSAYRAANSSQWSWNTTGDLMTYTHWADTEPSLSLEDEACMNFQVSRDGWDDDLCEIKLVSYICEIAAENGGEVTTEGGGPGGAAQLSASLLLPLLLLALLLVACFSPQ